MKLKHDRRMTTDEALEVLLGFVLVGALALLGFHIWQAWDFFSYVLNRHW